MLALSNFKKIHFIGIGGIGVSYLAQWFLSRGARVSGSNLSQEPILALLRSKGMRIIVGAHRASNIPSGTDLVVYTQAASFTNPERKETRRRGIPEMSHPEAVGELTKEKFTIAVCGAHGKSTTTSMIGLLMVKAGLDPTVFVGTKLKEFGDSNCRIGKSKYLVLEADEWKGTFWHYRPDIIVWTTVDREHLDFYKNFQGVLVGFRKFLGKLKRGGVILANANDQNLRKTILKSASRHIFYASKGAAANTVRRILKVPGEHNVSNALAALALADYLRVPRSTAMGALGEYRGAWRRFEYKGELLGAPVYDDYGHHPTEIKATLAACRSRFPGRRIVCLYQPHQYQRTKYLFKEFSGAFKNADVVVLLPIYGVAGREKKSLLIKVDAPTLAQSIRGQGTAVIYKPDTRLAAQFLKLIIQAQDVVIVMGAGDIWKIYSYLDLKRAKG